MRITRDKLNKLAHVVADTLAETDECDFLDDRNTIRQEARKALENLLMAEMKIDAAAKQKIASQRKIIQEGSQEWDILYRKYYNEEVKKPSGYLAAAGTASACLAALFPQCSPLIYLLNASRPGLATAVWRHGVIG